MLVGPEPVKEKRLARLEGKREADTLASEFE